MQHKDNLTLVQPTSNSELAIFEVIAITIKAITEYGGRLAIGWQSSGSDLICRYMTAIQPRLAIDLRHSANDRLIISLSNADTWCDHHDDLMPKHAKDLALQILRATRQSPRLQFKQQELQKLVGGSHHAN